jgi:hypothetical protein
MLESSIPLWSKIKNSDFRVSLFSFLPHNFIVVSLRPMGPLRGAMKSAMQGGLEATAIKDVLAIYGPLYRRRVYAWFQLARVLDAEKRAIIKKHPDFNRAWVEGNKFLLGEGVDAKFLMTPASFELAVNLALWVADHGRLS